MQFLIAYICTSPYRHTDQFLTQCDWLVFRKHSFMYIQYAGLDIDTHLQATLAG